MDESPRVFFSYARGDDSHRKVTAFRQALTEALQSVSGEPILVFQDREIRVGEDWRKRIDNEIDSSSVLVAILTPTFFKRDECRREVERFLAREVDLDRQGLVLPVHWVNVPGLADGDVIAGRKDILVRELSQRQSKDWRELRFRGSAYRAREMHAFASDIWKLLLELQDDSMKSNVRLPLQAMPLREVLQVWASPSLVPENQRRRLFIVVGGTYKYDEGGRELLHMKGDQSTEPVKGVVRVARALDRVQSGVLVDAICDYDEELQAVGAGEIDVILVGGGDTNKLSRRLFLDREKAEIDSLPIHFEPPTSSESIIYREGRRPLPRSSQGLILALHQPLAGIRNVLLCAGNGAQGTNASLSTLSGWLSGNLSQLSNESAALVEAMPDGSVKILWTGV